MGKGFWPSLLIPFFGSPLAVRHRYRQSIGFVLAGCIAASSASGENLHFVFLQGPSATIGVFERSGDPSFRSTPFRDLPFVCISYQKLRNFKRAFACIDELERRRASGQTRWKPAPWEPGAEIGYLPDSLRALIALDLGQWSDVVTHGERALKAHTGRNGSGSFSSEQAHFELLPALVVANARLGERGRAEAATLNLTKIEPKAMNVHFKEAALARCYLALDDPARALEQVTRDRSGWDTYVSAMNWLSLGIASAINKKIIGFTHRYRVQWRLMRGLAEVGVGETSAAKKTLDELLKMPELSQQGDMQWIALSQRAALAEAEGEDALAERLLRQAIEVLERQRASLTTEAGKIGFVGDKQAPYGRLVALLVKGGKAREAFEYVERAKSRALVDLLAAKQDFGVDGEQAARVREAVAELDRAAQRAYVEEETVAVAALEGAELHSEDSDRDSDTPPAVAGEGTSATGATAGAAASGDAGAPGVADVATAQVAQLRGVEVIRREIATVAPELGSLVSVSSAPVAELQGLIGAEEALVEYYLQGAELYGFVLSRSGVSAVRLEGGAGLLEEVKALRVALQDRSSQQWKGSAAALYRRLWAPLATHLTAERIVVVPHGPLHYLPFNVLEAPDGTLLIDRHALRLLPSASVLKYLKVPHTTAERRLLVLGNPDLGDPRLDLPYAEEEAQAVASLVPEARLLTRKAASLENFRRFAPAAERLHFATHGKFWPDRPLASGLYLATEGGGQGILTVDELYGTRLDAQLVTLSACETGLGEVTTGDDIIGLTRGFLYAGAGAIVATLWAVDDRATAELMESFYGRLEGSDVVQSLRQAQLATRSHYEHPYYWAAFQLFGYRER